MGILDDLKHQVERLGDKAKEGFDDAKDKAGDLLDDARERFGQHDEQAPLGESSDVGPDSTSTDAVQPGYVAGEDADESEADELADAGGAGEDADTRGAPAALSDPDDPSDLDDPSDGDAVAEEALVTEPATTESAPVAAAELDAEELVEDDDAADLAAAPADGLAADVDTSSGSDAEPEPVVETDVDPYDEPLSETIGDEIAAAQVDAEAVSEAVRGTSGDSGS